MNLSWTHFVDLISIEDVWKRAFYENECLKGNWSKRQLQRQIGSLLYERRQSHLDKTAINIFDDISQAGMIEDVNAERVAKAYNELQRNLKGKKLKIDILGLPKEGGVWKQK